MRTGLEVRGRAAARGSCQDLKRNTSHLQKASEAAPRGRFRLETVITGNLRPPGSCPQERRAETSLSIRRTEGGRLCPDAPLARTGKVWQSGEERSVQRQVPAKQRHCLRPRRPDPQATRPGPFAMSHRTPCAGVCAQNTGRLPASFSNTEIARLLEHQRCGRCFISSQKLSGDSR